MLSDQVLVFVVSLVVALGAATRAGYQSRPAPSKSYWVKASTGALGVAPGVLLTMFAGSGYGWGWPDLTAADARMIRLKMGLAVGLLYASYAWLLSRRLSVWAAVSVLVNVAIGAMPPHYNLLRLVEFAVGNYVVVFLWLSRPPIVNRPKRVGS